MSRRNLGEKIKLTSYDDMFGGVDANEVVVEGEIKEIPLSELHTFKDHPFSVIEDEKMAETVESIKKYGVLVPGIARPREAGGYEILSGHRRHHASALAGLETMPMIIKNCTDDEATIIMVDANIQREDVLPSEKARAYKMKFEALKHQGRAGGITIEDMAENSGESSKTVQRYIWLANLTDELLKLVDNKKLGFVQGVDISFLSKDKQKWVYDIIQSTGCSISSVQSSEIKELHKAERLTVSTLRKILSNEKVEKRKVTFNAKKLDSYFTPNMSNADIEELIIKLLDEWKEKGGAS